MRICHIAGPRGIHTQRWVSYFAGRGHEVHSISTDSGSSVPLPLSDRVHLHSLTRLAPQMWVVSKYLNGLLWALQTRRLVKRIAPDILDAHFITVGGYLGAVSGFHPLVLTAWGSDVLIVAKRNPLHRLLIRRCLRAADLVVCRTPLMKEEIVRSGVEPDRVKVSFPGVDTAEFSPLRISEKLREELKIPRLSPIVISTRTLSRVYDVETLVKAIPLVLAEVPQAEFVIAGEGTERNSLESLAQYLGIGDDVEFVGWVPHNEIPQYLAASDVYVSTSLSDGVSNSLLEAMASGLAPVVTDIPANRLWIRDGENGFLIPVKDHRALASKITLLLGSSDTRRRFGEINTKMTKEKAEHGRQMEELEKTYQSLLGAARR